MSNLNERFEKAKRQFQDRLKFQKFRELKTKIRTLKRKNNEIVEKATKKIESKEIESFSSDVRALFARYVVYDIVQLTILR
jgi:transcriptional regulator of heat shock response